MDSAIRVRPALTYLRRECIVSPLLMLTIEHGALWGVGQDQFSSGPQLHITCSSSQLMSDF